MYRADDDDEKPTTRGQLIAYGAPTADELEAINRQARMPFSADDVYVAEMLPSDTSVDSYFTHQDPATSLRNYAADAQAGLPVMNSHARNELPIGRTFAGLYLDGEHTTTRGVMVRATPQAPVVYEAAYIPRGMTLSRTSNDDIIRAMQGGIARDCSIAFGGPDYWYRCDECSRNMFAVTLDEDGNRDYCPHYPGMRLPAKGDKLARRVTATVLDARQLEVSPVWRGANGNAHLLRKAQDLVTRGLLSEGELVAIDAAMGLRIATRVDWQVSKRTFIMPETTNQPSPPAEQAQPTQPTPAPAATAQPNPEEARRAALDDVLSPASFTTLAEGIAGDPLLVLLHQASVVDEAGVRALLAQAEDGRTYRADLVTLCHEWGVRAQGVAYNRDVQERMLAGLGITDLRAELASRKDLAGKRFAKDDPHAPDPLREQVARTAAGGRQTVPAPGSLGYLPETVQGTAPGPAPVSSDLFKTRKRA